MSRLVANDLMKKAHRILKRRGELGRGMSDLPPRERRPVEAERGRTKPTQKQLVAMTESPAGGIGLAPTGALEPELRNALIDGINTYIDKVERVVMRRQSLEAQTPVLREENPLADPNAPTPEWLARNGNQVVKVSVDKNAPAKAHRIPTPIEKLSTRFDFSEEQALARFLQDSKHDGEIRTANWQSTGGGETRLGGLGNVPQHVRDGCTRFDWVMRSLSPLAVDVAKGLVLGTLRKEDESRFTLEDFAERILPDVKDRNRRWGLSAGALAMLADNLISLYRVCPVRVRYVDDEEREYERQKLITWETARV